MIVNFFTVRRTEAACDIHELQTRFGADVPQHMPLEGGTGANYLFCVRGDADAITKIAEESGYTVNGLYETSAGRSYTAAFKQMEVPEDAYNSKHQATIQYKGEPYALCMV